MIKTIIRSQYLDQLISLIGTPDIKVITGICRCGKSVLLKEFGKYLKKTFGEKANIISVDYNSDEAEPLLEYHVLYHYIEKKYQKGKRNFVFIDEVQMCPSFEKAINWLHNDARYDIYITGSNAFLLSSDLATLFTGRTFEIEVFPFSFKEYLQYFGRQDLTPAFNDYLLEGGMAGAYLYKTLAEKHQYVANVYETLIVRDINERYKVRNQDLMNKLSDFLMDNISSQTSTRNIANILSTATSEINDKTIGNYLKYLTDAFAFYRVRRYDIRGKKYLASQDKYYLADHAFRLAKLGQKNMDYGRLYENMVAIELKRRGYSTYVGTLYDKEIDFVATKRDQVLYIQVADDISRPETLERELSSLLSVKDAYPKMIIANTKHDDYTVEGVKIVDLAHWLAQ